MIENPKAPRIKRAAKLLAKKGRRESARFLVEGPQSVRELLKYRPDLAREVYATEETQDRHREFADLADAAGLVIESASCAVIAALSETVTPQGIVAVAEQFDTGLARFADEATSARSPAPRLVAILHEIRDPGNAGTILRVADATGADAVIFTGESIDPFHPKVVRSTTGSLFHVPVFVEPSLEHAIDRVREAGMRTIAADVQGADFLEARGGGMLARPTAWLFGNEARGLSSKHLALAEHALKLPIYGAAESLNLATAASVCLYESAFAQRQ